MSKNTFGYVEQIPEKIRDNFMWICQDMVSLQKKWDFFIELFGKKQNTDLFSKIARASFNIIFETLLNDITMAICRLSDPPKSMGHDNLSLASLVENCSEIDGLDTLLENFQILCEPISQRRNKRIAHRDLNTVINPLENPLPGVSTEQISAILETATEILNSILKNYCNYEITFQITSPGGATSLIYWLNKGRASNSRLTSDLIYNKE